MRESAMAFQGREEVMDRLREKFGGMAEQVEKYTQELSRMLGDGREEMKTAADTLRIYADARKQIRGSQGSFIGAGEPGPGETKRRNAEELEEAKKLNLAQTQLNDLTAAGQRRRVDAEFAHEKRLGEKKLELCSSICRSTASMMDGLYEETGDKNIGLFRMAQALSASQTIMHTAAAIMKTMSEVPFPANITESVLVGAMGAVQLGKITGQRPPDKKARGGFIPGPSHAVGGVIIEAEGGEYIHRASAVSTYGLRAMEAINAGLAEAHIPGGFRGADGRRIARSLGRAGAGREPGEAYDREHSRPVGGESLSIEPAAKSAIMNHINASAFEVKQALGV